MPVTEIKKTFYVKLNVCYICVDLQPELDGFGFTVLQITNDYCCHLFCKLNCFPVIIHFIKTIKPWKN